LDVFSHMLLHKDSGYFTELHRETQRFTEFFNHKDRYDFR